ncbi:FtsB family cell division protein [Gaetbulibacter aestuarii]|uniref:Septum formation initiator family protein n=1 Tax=Gaetbulibacter aestuarii TaxID=1502358 RepID=A0ABW7MZX9_9FLAO
MAFFKHKIFKPFKNIFILILTGFAIWMIFFDANSWLIHHELNNDIDDLKSEKDYYLEQIKEDNAAIKTLKTEEGLEKFAREKYYMKRDNEEIYIIEYEDSINANPHE